MDKQDYLSQLFLDIRDYVVENNIQLLDENGDEKDDVVEALLDDLWVADSVTGNGSGSYTYSWADAKDNLQGAESVIRDMIDDCFVDAESVLSHWLDQDYKWLDVSIRCYLVDQALFDYIVNLKIDHKYKEEQENESSSQCL